MILEEGYGIAAKKIFPVRGGIINTNFRIATASGDFLLKVYNLRTREQAEFEIGAFERLAQKNFPCPRPLRAADGGRTADFGGKPAVLFHYIPGAPLTLITPERLYEVGRGVACLHKTLRRHPQAVVRDEWEPEDIGRFIRTQSATIIRKRFPGAKNFVRFIEKEFSTLKLPSGLPSGLTHQDIKPDNIIVAPDGICHIIDFDNMYRGVLLYDMMTTIIWTCFPGTRFSLKRFEAFMRGYERERRLTNVERRAVPEALRFRLLREAFVWPMRFSPRVARRNAAHFLASYRHLPRDFFHA